MPVIETDNLVKQYGKVEALGGVSLKVEPGEIFGLLGQNGAGKTTLVKILLGITRATAGQAHLLGLPAGTAAVRRRIGYLPEDHRFPEYHTGYSLLEFYGTLLGVRRRELLRRIGEMLDLVGLKGRKDHKIRTYSKGMKQRIGIAQALLHDPDVIFLDEPTDGVDPVGRREIRRILQQLKSDAKTIFINSHMLGEVELICDRVAILRAGKLIREGDIAELTHQRGVFVIGLAPGQHFPREEIAARGYEVAPQDDCWEIGLRPDQNIDPIVDLLRGRGLSIRHLREKRQTLEDMFMETVLSSEPGIDGRARSAVRTTAIQARS